MDLKAKDAFLLILYLCIKVTLAGPYLSHVFRVGPIKKRDPLPATAYHQMISEARILYAIVSPSQTFAKVFILRWSGEHIPSKSWPN